MSQVFSVSCIDDQMGVAFQGFYKRGRFTQAKLLHAALLTARPRRSEAWPRYREVMHRGGLPGGSYLPMTCQRNVTREGEAPAEPLRLVSALRAVTY